MFCLWKSRSVRSYLYAIIAWIVWWLYTLIPMFTLVSVGSFCYWITQFHLSQKKQDHFVQGYLFGIWYLSVIYIPIFNGIFHYYEDIDILTSLLGGGVIFLFLVVFLSIFFGCMQVLWGMLARMRSIFSRILGIASMIIVLDIVRILILSIFLLWKGTTLNIDYGWGMITYLFWFLPFLWVAPIFWYIGVGFFGIATCIVLYYLWIYRDLARIYIMATIFMLFFLFAGKYYTYLWWIHYHKSSQTIGVISHNIIKDDYNNNQKDWCERYRRDIYALQLMNWSDNVPDIIVLPEWHDMRATIGCNKYSMKDIMYSGQIWLDSWIRSASHTSFIHAFVSEKSHEGSINVSYFPKNMLVPMGEYAVYIVSILESLTVLDDFSWNQFRTNPKNSTVYKTKYWSIFWISFCLEVISSEYIVDMTRKWAWFVLNPSSHAYFSWTRPVFNHTILHAKLRTAETFRPILTTGYNMQTYITYPDRIYFPKDTIFEIIPASAITYYVQTKWFSGYILLLTSILVTSIFGVIEIVRRKTI